ncbi:EAL domain-containing protein [Rhodopseudomonas sp. HC1]|uniref:putative bifunctional diguanylate cyclase/phosphodiesterase n=1 Tax=Rhodopseudomonas infernalis TaxID=2897386 RepID=UPI001EE82763|nr:EAL domain-containing protein [Rhodopseudomonas infernalis]MCG6205333.1 EAL domain-containing protein [Rhodopseudomonas infernalis]
MCSAATSPLSHSIDEIGSVPDAAGDRVRVASRAVDPELLQAVIRALPSGVTVQDESGDFLIVNDAAAARMALASAQANSAPAPRGLEAPALLTAGAPAIIEEQIGAGASARTYLTAQRPIELGGRRLVLSSASDITEQKATEHRLFRRAYFDELTGLPNRSVIEHRADTLLRDDGPANRFALAFLDIDNFKHINDYYGHAVGDALLVGVAKRLGLELRETDMLSRISGDEFLLLLNPIQSRDEVVDYIEFLLQRLRAPFFIDGTEVFASASTGVSLYPEHGRSFDALRQNADIAMYQVKSATKGAAAMFDVAMEREALERMAIEQSLRQAILDKRFCCAFQPKVDIRTRDIKGIEALVRLRDDNGVIQAPGTFVDLAVELGLIDDLTHLVLAEITRSIDLIDDTFGAGVSISINVAAKQAGNAVFMRSFCAALVATGFPARFVVEVTEDAFVAKSHFQSEILPLLRRIGVGISIDDFGIGYSSLSALADITADEIKIDRSFITDIHKRPRSQGILKAIESLGEALGMTVIAEGLETFEELAYLQSATKIRYAQGYYFSKPIFLEELKPAMQTGSGRASPYSRTAEPARAAISRANVGRA